MLLRALVPAYASGMGFYEPPREEEPGGCRDVWLLTRVTFAIIAWPLIALVLVLSLLVATFVAFATHPALALIPLAVLVGGIAAFAWWDARRGPPNQGL